MLCSLLRKKIIINRKKGVTCFIPIMLPWEMEKLYRLPAVYPLQQDQNPEVKAIFYQGLPYRGKETRVFACYGVPRSASAGEPVPAVVLVHGGAGTAYPEWVQRWMERGYAAIAMDLEGQLPLQESRFVNVDQCTVHPWSGPVKQGVFADYQLPVEDQWMYHAVAAVILAHTVIGSLPEVDSSKVGLTGISWGGIITSLVAGIDRRLCFAMPVYGCGFLYEPGTLYGRGFAAMPPADAERIRKLWDPSSYLTNSALPMLWLNSSNDTHFPLAIFDKSFALQQGGHTQKSMMSLHCGLNHSYADAWTCQKLYAFADSIVKDGPSLIQVLEYEQRGDWLVVRYASLLPVVQAVLYWCEDEVDWRNASWEAYAVCLSQEDHCARVSLPQARGKFFMNLTNDRGWITSTRVLSDNREIKIQYAEIRRTDQT
ncbi:hypothetical protein DMN77_03425 [Paenibacillus sp. 79R4]|nr:hypothetical protein [Paenibacillus sp. 79R4]